MIYIGRRISRPRSDPRPKSLARSVASSRAGSARGSKREASSHHRHGARTPRDRDQGRHAQRGGSLRDDKDGGCTIHLQYSACSPDDYHSKVKLVKVSRFHPQCSADGAIQWCEQLCFRKQSSLSKISRLLPKFDCYGVAAFLQFTLREDARAAVWEIDRRRWEVSHCDGGLVVEPSSQGVRYDGYFEYPKPSTQVDQLWR